MLLFVVLLCGCNKQYKAKKDSSFSTIGVDFDEKKSTESSYWFSQLEIIPLETKDNSLLSLDKGFKIQYFENNFYILDKGQNDIFVFDSYGNHKYNSKQKKGGGPEEYHMIYDFDINRETREIEILDIAVYKIKKYNLDFTYIDNITLPEDVYPIKNFKIISSKMYCFYHTPQQIEKPALKIYYSDENKIQEYLVLKKDKRPSTQSDPFYVYNDQVYFTYSFPNEELFQICENGENIVNKVLEYDLGKYTLSFDKKIDESIFTPDFFNRYSDYVFLTNKYENNECYYNYIFYDNKYFMLKCNKETKEQDLISGEFSDSGVLLSPFFIDDLYFYVLASPEYLKEVVSLKLLDEKSKKILENISVDDNPVILKYYLK